MLRVEIDSGGLRRERGDGRPRRPTPLLDEAPQEEIMLSSGTDPDSYITEYTLVYEEQFDRIFGRGNRGRPGSPGCH